MKFFYKPTDQMFGLYALLLAIAMVGVVLTAWVFQWFGYVPCKLCLQQREPYYLAVPLLIVAALSALVPINACVSRGLVLVAGLLMVYGAVLGVYHSGVEWGWWLGPQDCGATSGNVTNNANALLETIDNTKPPACDEAAGRFIGLSFAGWNVVASIALISAIFYLLRRD